MRAITDIEQGLLDEAKELTGLSETATAEEVLRHFVEDARRRQALEELRDMGWDAPHHVAPSFDELAREFRALTAGRQHTPSEILMREGRDER
jgi:Arc/MetJ family transcription regulator